MASRYPRSGCDRRAAARAAGFTLIELLVVMGVIAVLSVLTLVAARRISRDARLAIGTNTVIAALGEGRTLAIKDHKVVMVVFKPRLLAPGKQVVEAMLAEWTGETFPNAGPFNPLIDRFELIPDAPVRQLPEGISIAGPFYHWTNNNYRDDLWSPLTYLPAINQQTGAGELAGRPAGVMFGADGSRLLRNSKSDSNRTWVDFNGDGLVRKDHQDYAPTDPSLAFSFEQYYYDDEPNVSLAPFLTVFDEADARERRGLDWSVPDDYDDEFVGPDGYITKNSKRIHFNRYSGVVMR